MNLSEEVVKGLELFANAEPFSNDVFAKIVTLAFEIILKRKDESALRGRFAVVIISPIT